MVTTAEGQSTSRADGSAGSPPGTARSRLDRRDLLAAGILLGALLLPLGGLMRSPGPPMEEGFMLVFPERVLAGDVPNRDFLHLYGPGSLWVLAGVYEVFGIHIRVERLFGLLQHAGLVTAMFFVARWWGRRIAVTAALVALLVSLPAAGLTAFAWTGGVALALGGIALGLHVRATTDDRRARVLAVLAGVAFGAAFLFRLDLVVGIGLAGLVLVWRMPRSRVVPLAVAAGATASLVLVQVALAGVGTAFRGMVLEPVFDLRPGRRLPIPPGWRNFDGFPQIIGALRDPLPWPLPTLAPPKQLFFWFFLNVGAIAVAVAVGIGAVRRDGARIQARALLASSLFALGIVSQALQRPDSTHIAWVSCVSIALLPMALVEVVSRARDGTWLHRHARVVACAAPLVALAVVLPNFSVRAYADSVVQTFGARRYHHTIQRGDRVFYHGDPSVAKGANAMVPVVADLVDPGDRLFVGPVDLRRTVTSEAWIYHLFPETVPGTRYIEMDPGIADAPGSGLAEDLAASDVAVLSNIWREWFEPNESTEPGDDAATRVLRREFCRVGRFGRIPDGVDEIVGARYWFEVYRRCDPA